MSTHKEVILQALANYLGDDLYRARTAFKNCSPEMMQQQYGQSGRTRAAILSEYEAHNSKVLAAIAYAKALP